MPPAPPGRAAQHSEAQRSEAPSPAKTPSGPHPVKTIKLFIAPLFLGVLGSHLLIGIRTNQSAARVRPGWPGGAGARLGQG